MLAALAVVILPCRTAQTAEWRAFDTEHFVVLSQASERRSREIFRRFQVFLQALPMMTNLPVKPPQIPTRVFLLEDADFHRIAADQGAIAGLFSSSAFEGHIVINASRDAETSLILIQHEYLHFSVLNAGITGLPAFYEEGLAQIVEYFTVRGRQFLFGYFPPEYKRSAKSSLMPLSRLLEIRVDSDEYRSEHHQETFYARSLLLLHYCLIDNPACREPLTRLVSRLADGDPAVPAFTQEFGMSPEAFDRMLDDYLSRNPERHFATMPSTKLDKAPMMQIRELEPAEAEVEFAELLLKLAPRDKQLVGQFEPLLATPAYRGRALAGQAAAFELEDRNAEADVLLDELLSLPGASAAELVDAGFLLLDRASRLVTDGTVPNEASIEGIVLRARRFFDAALARDPRSEQAAFGYGMTQINVPDDIERSARLVSAASERLPGNADLAMLRALHAELLGDRETAMSIMRVAVCGAASPDMRQIAKQALGQVRCFKPN